MRPPVAVSRVREQGSPGELLKTVQSVKSPEAPFSLPPSPSCNGRAKGAEDNMKTAECFAQSAALFDRFFLVKLGKKKHQLIELTR